MNEIDARLTVALEAARKGGELALSYFRARETLVVEHKGKQDLVSRADREVEEVIRDVIGKAFPGDSFLGEEGGGTEAGSLWVIDPIDGTMNFLRGIPYWGVLIAYVRNRETLIGVTHDPNHAETWWATKGGGAFRDGTPVRVSGVTDPAQAVMALSFNFKFPIQRYTTMLEKALAAGIDHRRIGSSALKLAYVAEGRFDGFVSYDTNSWDVLPGLLLVREAGGVCTDFAKGHDMTKPRSVVASAPGIAKVMEDVTGLSAS